MEFRRVLGISLGTRKMGLAVIDRYSIFDCRVRSFSGKWSREKKAAILAVLQEYIDVYKVNCICMKMPMLSIEAPAIAELGSDIVKLTSAMNIILQKCTLSELKEGLGLTRGANKQTIMQKIVEKYPELFNEFERTVRKKENHYVKLFEAVAASLSARFLNAR